MRILVACHATFPALVALATAVAVMTLAAPVHAQQSNQKSNQSTQKIYKWKDARGIPHYSQKPPPSGKYTTQTLPAPAAPAPAPRDDSGATAPVVSTDVSPSPIAPATPAPSAPSAPSIAPAQAPSATAASSHAHTRSDSRCDTARKNLQVLQGSAPVLIDSNSDGKPDKPLNDIERNNQLELARATFKAYACDDGQPIDSR